MLNIVGLDISIGHKKIFFDINCQFDIGLNRIVGVNGSGKTTFLSCISGINKIDKGKINLIKDNKNHPFKLQKQGFYLSDHIDFYHFLTGLDIIKLIKRYKKINCHHQLDDYLTGFGISGYLNTKFGDMSLGTKKKLLLTSALMTDVDVYILDEPTNGLDVTSMSFLKEKFNSLADQKIIIFSSHDESFLKDLNIHDYRIHENRISKTGS
ncbi:ATP-binding cassette domain-containing protein [Xenorhabdus bovienii]|uniref:ATP-binding cassette domain-containing protein n=1 Tax=Xenorhabdus bovienii TaxID=40576 RepID=UPI0023B327E6|nr:ATP-binding cassette domain-containing protein [Xenorhabdus bovienii]MDE9482329.1 ATP-binding cassette domain-containing protein [Xenorhabdus bovienii]